MNYQKKRQGGYYNQRNQKKKRDFVLEPGIHGFLCTCNSREKECVQEAYNILNLYADELYGAESKPALGGNKEPGTVEENSEKDDDIGAELSKEISELKQSPKQRRFQVVESGANNCVFIRTTLDDPTELAHHIMKDIDVTKKQRSRFLLRLIPVEVTCKAYMDEIQKSAASLFEKYFSKEGKTYAIAFNHRNNHSISRNDIIEKLAEMVQHYNPENKVDLSQPDLTIIVEVVRAMCCMSIVPEYHKLLKYNLLELCGKGEKAAREAKIADTATGDGNDCTSKEVKGKDGEGKEIEKGSEGDTIVKEAESEKINEEANNT